MGKQIFDRHDEVLLWKAAWDELEGYLIQKSGEYQSRKARLTRLHIRKPMPNDIPRLSHIGAKRKMCAQALVVMASIKDRLYKGRSLPPWQDRAMAQKAEEEEDGDTG